MSSRDTDRNSIAHMVSSKEAADRVTSNKVQHKQKCDDLQQISDSKIPEPDHQKGSAPAPAPAPASTPEKEPVEPERGILHSEESKTSAELSEQASKTPARAIPPLQYCLEGSSPIIREKVSEDGYNWRKYGQKLVKGNEFVRSYYKCTHPKCLAKKQLERSHDWQMIDTICFGQHDHPKPNSTPLTVGLVFSIVEERQSKTSRSVTKEEPSETQRQTPHQTQTSDTIKPLAVSLSDDIMKDGQVKLNRMKDEVNEDDHQSAKRRKKDGEANPVDKPTGGARVIVQTQSEADIAIDGYRWRKYGQKLVKGNPHPRSYYRCSSPGCAVKKHVERASHDPKLLLTTYEGKHDHDMPPPRIVTHVVAGSDVQKLVVNKNSGSFIERNMGRCRDMIIYSDSVRPSEPTNQSNSKAVQSGLSMDRKPNEPQNESNESEEKGNACRDLVVYVNTERSTPNVEPVRS